MCLAIPARVTSIDGLYADVEVGGIGRRVSIQLTPEVQVGEYVLLHTGYAISIVDADARSGDDGIGGHCYAAVFYPEGRA